LKKKLAVLETQMQAFRDEMKLAKSNPFSASSNHLNGFKDFRTKNGSSQGQNLALTGVCVPSSEQEAGGTRSPNASAPRRDEAGQK